MPWGQNSNHKLFIIVQVFFEKIEKQLTYQLRDNNYKWFQNFKEELLIFRVLVSK